MSMHMSIHTFMYMPIRVSTRISTHRSICMSMCMSIVLHMSIHMRMSTPMRAPLCMMGHTLSHGLPRPMHSSSASTAKTGCLILVNTFDCQKICCAAACPVRASETFASTEYAPREGRSRSRETVRAFVCESSSTCASEPELALQGIVVRSGGETFGTVSTHSTRILRKLYRDDSRG